MMLKSRLKPDGACFIIQNIVLRVNITATASKKTVGFCRSVNFRSLENAVIVAASKKIVDAAITRVWALKYSVRQSKQNGSVTNVIKLCINILLAKLQY